MTVPEEKIWSNEYVIWKNGKQVKLTAKAKSLIKADIKARGGILNCEPVYGLERKAIANARDGQCGPDTWVNIANVILQAA